MAQDNKKKRYVIYMTEEQKEITCGIFNFHGWDIEISSDDDTEATSTQYQNLSRTSTETKSVNSDVCEKEISEENANMSTDQQNGSSELATGNTDVCHHCLSSPCVTASPQAWLGDGRLARPGNNLIRKKLYRKYWTMLDRRGLWSNSVYLERKERLMLAAHVELTVREIMPDCVLHQVRQLYPNPKDVPYMGHFF
jgi:hypothetical protein